MPTQDRNRIPCLSDNYAYLVKSGDACAVVDPSEPAPVKAALARAGLDADPYPQHPSPSGSYRRQSGPEAGIRRQGGGAGKGRGAHSRAGYRRDEAAGWEFDGRKVQVLEVPAHTRGAITFVIDGNAFTGDTLFAMGCGRLFEGDAAMMWASLSKLMRLPDDTRIWCGHEYTQKQWPLRPDPGAGQCRASGADGMPCSDAGKGEATVPSTMALEKATNPFLRPDSPEIRKSLGMETAGDVAVFGEIRERKDSF